MNKEQIKAEIERRNLANYCGTAEQYEEELFTILDTLPEEKPSEDLGQAAIDAAQLDMQDRQIMEDSHEHRMLYSRVFRRGFKAGAQWQKEQMMKDAKAAEIGYWNQLGLSILTEQAVERMPYDEGDKVKIIIVKEDAK